MAITLNGSTGVAATALETLSTSGDVGYRLGYNSGSSAFIHRDSATGHYLLQADETGSSWQIQTDNGAGPVTHLEVDRYGNVGIGTSSPTESLHINGGALGLQNGSNATITGKNHPVVYATLGTGSGLFSGYGNLVIQARDTGTASDSNIVLSTGSGSPERMRINSSGKVGIATDAPDALLNVGGTGTALGGTAGNEVKLLTLEVASANRDRLQFTSERITTGTDWESAAHRIQRMVDTTTMGYMQFGHAGDDGDLISFGKTNEEFMRIAGNGNLIIGKTVEDGSAAGHFFSSSGYSRATRNGSMSILNRLTSDGSAMDFQKSGIGVGSITVTGSATAYNTSSDYRLKTDAQPMTGASARVQELNPVNFEWLSNGTRVDGFLAHEAQAVVPEAVVGTQDAMKDEEYEVTPAVLDDEGNVTTEAVMDTRSVPDYQGIDQSKLVPLLTAALQEALTKIEAMETRLTALEE